MEFEVRFGRASVGLEMEREMGKHLEPHIVPSRFQLIYHATTFVSIYEKYELFCAMQMSVCFV